MKIWKKPALTILTRSQPEELILSTCKDVAVGGTPQGSVTSCFTDSPDLCSSPCGGIGAS